MTQEQTGSTEARPAAPQAAAPATLRIPRVHFDHMVAHARRESPKEACGFLAGKDSVPVDVFESTNVDPNPVVRYQMTPKDIIAFDRVLEEKGWDWLGVYHSHTFSEAYPSPTDIGNAVTALAPGLLYLILSLKEENEEELLYKLEHEGVLWATLSSRKIVQPTIRAFNIEGATVTEVPVVIED
jgi:proteasome lid subunit RPN8/RPN11